MPGSALEAVSSAEVSARGHEQCLRALEAVSSA